MECGKFEQCAKSMPYEYVDGIWNTPQEKRKWMRKHLKDCFIEESFWDSMIEFREKRESGENKKEPGE